MPEIYNDIRIVPARQSASCSLPVRLAIVDYRLVGTHEKAHPARVLEQFMDCLRYGYRDPAISVFQQHTDKIFNELRDNQPTDIFLRDYGQIGVADGHHRLTAITLLDMLGLLQSHTIPVQVLPMRDAHEVRFITKNIGSSLGDHEIKQLTVADIESCFSKHDAVIPPNLATLFEVRFKDGTYDRLRLGQPDVVIERSDFLNDAQEADDMAKSVENLTLQKIDLLTDADELVQRLYSELS